MNNKKLFPKTEKNVSTIEVIIKTDKASFMVLFVSSPCVITVNIGIRENGSTATKALKKF
jgi:hypothetical protein